MILKEHLNWSFTIVEPDGNIKTAGSRHVYDIEITVFDLWMNWKYEGIKVWQQMAQEWFGSLGTERVVVDFTGVEIQATEKMAFASAFVKYTSIHEDGKNLRSQQNRLSWVLQLKDNSWKVIHEHTSAPADFNSMKVILQPN